MQKQSSKWPLRGARPPRRTFLIKMACGLTSSIGVTSVRAQSLCSEGEVTGNDESECLSRVTITKDEWVEATFGRAFGKPISVSRFLDRIYYLNRELTWKADAPSPELTEVIVPKGFVTDFASIPRLFWAVLAPDDEYLLAAVVHDWLYWKQDISREVADLALKLGMEELKVPTWKTAAIYRAVRMFGQSAWDDNAKSKIAGEKRILRVVPDDVTVRWSDWKLRPEVF